MAKSKYVAVWLKGRGKVEILHAGSANSAMEVKERAMFDPRTPLLHPREIPSQRPAIIILTETELRRIIEDPEIKELLKKQ